MHLLFYKTIGYNYKTENLFTFETELGLIRPFYHLTWVPTALWVFGLGQQPK